MSDRDYFLKSAKVFGRDAARVRAALAAAGCKDFITDAQWPYLEFPLRYVSHLRKTLPEIEIGVCYSIVERRNGEACVRELRVDATTPTEFDPQADI